MPAGALSRSIKNKMPAFLSGTRDAQSRHSPGQPRRLHIFQLPCVATILHRPLKLDPLLKGGTGVLEIVPLNASLKLIPLRSSIPPRA
jgi:hypothetical protein